MEIEKRQIKKHLFVCCNLKEEGSCCAGKESAELVNSLKKRLRENNLWDEYKVSRSGCLGPCSKGIAATLYPDNLLITKLSIGDEETLYQMIIDNSY